MNEFNAGDLFDEAAGITIRRLGPTSNTYQLVPFDYCIVVLQQFTIEMGAELDLEGELVVL